MQNPGRMQVTDQHVAFKNTKTGKLETVASSKFKNLQWTRLANKTALQITDKEGVLYRYSGLNEQVIL